VIVPETIVAVRPTDRIYDPEPYMNPIVAHLASLIGVEAEAINLEAPAPSELTRNWASTREPTTDKIEEVLDETKKRHLKRQRKPKSYDEKQDCPDSSAPANDYPTPVSKMADGSEHSDSQGALRSTFARPQAQSLRPLCSKDTIHRTP
jgi:hypothetical protein